MNCEVDIAVGGSTGDVVVDELGLVVEVHSADTEKDCLVCAFKCGFDMNMCVVSRACLKDPTGIKAGHV